MAKYLLDGNNGILVLAHSFSVRKIKDSRPSRFELTDQGKEQVKNLAEILHTDIGDLSKMEMIVQNSNESCLSAEELRKMINIPLNQVWREKIFTGTNDHIKVNEECRIIRYNSIMHKLLLIIGDREYVTTVSGELVNVMRVDPLYECIFDEESKKMKEGVGWLFYVEPNKYFNTGNCDRCSMALIDAK